jgi:putative nucleotidyltransferase with HDIG domain
MTEQQEKILIVDDENSIRKLLSRKLTQSGYICEEAGCVNEAMEAIKNNDVKLVILDIKLPDIAGTDILQIIQSKYPNISVIMTSSITNINTAIECMKNGADDYVFKPFNLNEVAMCVSRTLEKRNLQLQIEDYHNNMEEKISQQSKEIRTVFLEAIKSLVFALEDKDEYTTGHSMRVAEISVAIGKDLGLSPEEIEDLRWASLLHDVGKIAVDQIIQNKPEKLTIEEYEHIMVHASIGANIIRPVVNENIIKIIEHHHDHYDGSGWHQTISGEKIPLGARILAISDAFVAMISSRPYRSAKSINEAVAEIKRCSGSQFDAEITRVFLDSTLNKISALM